MFVLNMWIVRPATSSGFTFAIINTTPLLSSRYSVTNRDLITRSLFLLRIQPTQTSKIVWAARGLNELAISHNKN